MVIFLALQIVTAGKNSLNNRFLPFSNIETEAILAIDDDQKIPLGEIQLAFRYMLYMYPVGIVGTILQFYSLREGKLFVNELT